MNDSGSGFQACKILSKIDYDDNSNDDDDDNNNNYS